MRDQGHEGLLMYICIKSRRSCTSAGSISFSHIGHGLRMMYIIVRKLIQKVDVGPSSLYGGAVLTRQN